ncbi:hypothetical protein BH23BAC1_BH23BAC1_32960 [soil metagenome]
MKLFYPIIILLLNCGYINGQKIPDFVKGIYGNPGTLLEAGYDFKSLGVNAIFIRSISLNEEIFNSSKSQDVKVYVEFPTLNGKDYLQHHPDAWPINEKGEKASPADWFMGICPTDQGFFDYRMNQLKSILSKYEIDGIWLDYLHWHAQFETPEPILPETCFCNRCTKLFSEAMAISVPSGSISRKAQWILSSADSSWRAWRSQIINYWVTEMKNEVKKSRPEALLGIFYCSWFPSDYDGALYNILGLDVKTLAGIADVLSPMLFHMMMGRSVDWVQEYTLWLKNYTGNTSGKNFRIWPIVQAHDHPGTISAIEFRQVMLNGSEPPSTGIMMFSDQALIKNPEKVEVMKKLYQEDLK